MKVVNQYNFFKEVKLDEEGYLEIIITDYVNSDNIGVNQYETYKTINLDDEGRLYVTVINE